MAEETPITHQHRRSLFGLCKELGISHRAERLAVIGALVQKKIGSFNSLTESDWRDLRDRAWPDWPEESDRGERWTLGRQFKQEAERARNEYAERIGQMRLPIAPL